MMKLRKVMKFGGAETKQERASIGQVNNNKMNNMRERERERPESSVAVEINIQTHEEKGSCGKDCLAQPESQTGAASKRPWQLLHSTIVIQPQTCP